MEKVVAAQSITVAGGALFSPANTLLSSLRSDQPHLTSSLSIARSQLDMLKSLTGRCEDVLGSKLPRYTKKLELLSKNLKVLKENAQKTKELGSRIAQDAESALNVREK